MSKAIFILSLLLTSLNSFSQTCYSKEEITQSKVSKELIIVESKKINSIDETEIDLLLNNNLSENLSIKPSDLLNEEMLKKLKAKV
jgi:hypothetical protein